MVLKKKKSELSVYTSSDTIAVPENQASYSTFHKHNSAFSSSPCLPGLRACYLSLLPWSLPFLQQSFLSRSVMSSVCLLSSSVSMSLTTPPHPHLPNNVKLGARAFSFRQSPLTSRSSW